MFNRKSLGCLFGGLFAASAIAGPDVIVSNIADFTKYGTVSNVTGYAMTTVSCNIGNQVAIWIDCTSGAQCNQHPVIGQTMYRYKVVNGAGRMEMIGQSWLKHGFCAADGGTCVAGPGVPNGSCDWLGTNQTDTYSAGLNADQPDLGPKSEINPYTGQFVYPYVRAWNQSGNAIFKRLQVHNDDASSTLNPVATYFGESQYVCTDELPFGAIYNNMSYRRLQRGSFTSGGWNFSYVSSTVRETPALEAWATMETGVTIVDVDVPGDGRFVLAYKVTPLTGGTYNYEYALLNMNSDRAAQSFSVPMVDGSAASSVGFHDVPYHSGEPFDGTDWPGTKTATSLRWETTPHATNANANALRWGTTYNFRFVSNAPPVPGNVTIGLFKPGTVGSVTAAAMVPRPLGDTNCDGVTNFDDIDSFITAMIGQDAYTSLYPGCVYANADMDNNGSVNFDDIGAFVNALIPVPQEP